MESNSTMAETKKRYPQRRSSTTLKKGDKIAEVEVDWNEADKLRRIGCTCEEMVAVLGVSWSTMERKCKAVHGIPFDEYVKKGNQNFKVSLRRLQARGAQGYTEIIRDEQGNILERKYNPPNITMQIWLGKQFLNQKEKSEIDQNINLPTLPDIIIK